MSIQYEHNMMGKTNSAESIFSQWKESSPYKQERLAILKQIDTRDWEKLIDFDEQKKFNLQSDEFLIYADKWWNPVPKIIKKFLCLLVLIYLPQLVYLRFFDKNPNINIQLIENNATLIIISGNIFLFLILIYILLTRLGRYFFITNKKIYITSKKENTSININGLYIKNNFSLYEIKNIKNDKMSKYKFWINFSLISDFFSREISLKYKNNKNELYMLYVVSFLIEKYAYIAYIYPICCSLKSRQNNLFVRFVLFLGPLLNPGAFFMHSHMFDTQNEDINIRFSSREKLVSFINNRTFKNHKCKNEILSLAVQGKPVPDEELFIIEARSYMFHKYIISIHKSYIQTIYKGNILKLKIEEYKDNIFNSNKSFVFVFLYQGNRIILQAKKKDIDIPFLEIMENISGSLILFYRTPFAEWWIS